MDAIPPELALSIARWKTDGPALLERLEAVRALGFSRFSALTTQLPQDPGVLIARMRARGLRLACARLPAPDPARVEGFSGAVWLSSADDEGRAAAVRETVRAARIVEAMGGGRRGGGGGRRRGRPRALIVRPGFVPVPGAPLRHESMLEALAGGDAAPREGALREARDLVGREEGAALDRVCRGLFEVCRAVPGVRICLEPAGSFHEIPQLSQLPMILSDVSASNLRYWHDPVRCHRMEALGLARHEAWLDESAGRLEGMSLHDARGPEEGLPPGSGAIDFRMLGFFAPGCRALVLEASPEWGEGWVPESLGFLRARGVLGAPGS